MRYGPVLLLLVTAGVVGWMAPDLTTNTHPSKAELAVQASKASEAAKEARRQAWLAGTTVVERSGDGHFYVDARVEGAPTHFLVDTGASIVALTADDARAAGLDWNEDDVIAIGRGASGTVYGVPAHLKRVELDGIVAHDVQAAIIPEGLDVSLLGQSFLSQVPGVSIDDDRLKLGS